MDKIKELLQAALDELNKTNVVKQNTHPRRYVPEIGDTYFLIGADGVVHRDIWDNYSIDKYYLAIENVYRTEEDAQKVVDRKKLIKELWQEDGVFLDPDWSDEFQDKYCLLYSCSLGKWLGSKYQSVQIQFELPYFKSDEAAEAVIEKYGSRLDVLL